MMRKGLKWFDDKFIGAYKQEYENPFFDKFMPRFTNLGGLFLPP